ncbi:LPXTG cell wall anchor domain-containing protein, partial [Streptococcus suis]|nr:LPXTG cell wall anchor domain-containing protein [Streptococcus suis]
NESEASEPKVATTPDTTAPEAPTIETDLTGKAGTTDPVKVTGAEPGSTVTLKDKDGNVIGTGTADENGVATITPTTPLPEGQVTATSTDEAGNESEASEPKVATTPDTTAPEAPVVNAPKEGDTTVTGTTEPGATVTVTFPDGSTVTTTADENGNYTVDVPAGVELKEGDKVTATATDEAGNTSTPTETTTTANPSDADENTPNTPAVTPVEDPNNLTDDEKAKVKEEVEKANPDLPTGTEVTVGNDGTVTVTYPDGSVDTIPGTDTVTPITDTTAPEAPVVNAPKAGDTTVTGTAEPGSTVTVTFPDGSTATTTADENGNYTVDVPAGVELKEGDKVSATATDEAGNTSTPTEATTTANPSDADENTPNTPAVTPVADTNNLTDDEKAKVKEEVEKSNPDLPTGTTVEVGNDGTVTITYPDGSVDTIPGTDTVTPNTDTTAPEAPVVNAPKAGDTTVTGTTEPGATVTVTFPDGTEVTTTADENGNYTVDVPAGVELKDGDKVTATATDEAGNTSTPTEATTTANPSDADENTPNTPAVTPVADTNNLTDDEKAKVKEEVEKSNPDLPTGTTVEVGNDGTVTITYPDGSVDTIPGTDTVTPNTDTTAPEAPVVNAPKAGDTTVTGTTEPGATVTVTFPDGSTVTTTADEDGNYTVDVPAGVELKEGDKVTATATDEAGNTSTPTEATTTANPSDADENTPNTPAVTPVADTNNLTDDEKAKVKEEVEKANPDLPTGTEVTVGNDGTVTVTYPDGSVDTIPGTDTVTPITDTTAPEAPVVNAPKEGDTTVTGTTEPGATVIVTFPDGSTVTTTADEDGNYTVDVPAGVELKEGDKVTATATDEAGNTSTPTESTTTANPSDADENTPNVPAVTPVEDPNNLTDEEKAKVKEEVEKANPDLPTGTEVTVGNDGTVTITYPDGSVDTIPGTDTVTPITDTTAPEAPVVNAPKEGDTTVTGTTEPGATVTVTFPDGSTVTTTADENGNYTVDVPAGVELKEGDKVTATATDEAGNTSTPTETTTTANPSDADENTPNTPAVTPVEDPNNLTDDEKAKVKEEVEKANPDLPTGTEVTVGNDGTVTVTYPDGSVDTIPGTDTVVSTTPTPQTDTEKNDLTNPIKTPVGDTNNLTEDEKAKVKEEVEKANPGLPTGTEVTVGNDGTVTITYPDGSIDTIPGTDTVVSTTPTPQTDAEKNDLTNPTKTPVTDVNNLTDDEKAKVKEEVEKSNPNLPTGTTVEVGNDGTVTITYPDGSVDTIPGTDTVVTTTPTPQTDAEKNDLTNPTKTPVADTNNLTDDEKAKVKDEVEKSNPDLPSGTTITVGNDGTATITYPDGSTDTLTGTVTVIGTTPTPQTDAEKNDLTNPTKTPVADTNNLTEDEKAKVKEEVEKSNPDLPSGTTITVGNDGTATITYPDGSTDTLTGTVTVIGTTPTPQTDAEKNDLTNPTKTPVADTNNLTEDEKAKVKEEVEKSNPNLPTGTTVEVGNDGTVTVTYPDGSVDTIPGTDTVATEPPYKPVPQTDAEKNGITNPTKTPVADTNNLTEEEKAKVKEEVEKSNPNLPSGTTIEVGNDGSVAITYPDGSIDIIPGADTVVPTTPVPQTDAEKNDVTNPAKTPVADTNNLTEDEKAKVKEEVEKSNPGLPTGTTIEVSNGGSVTITYPDGSIDIIPGADTVVPTTPVPQTDAEKNDVTNPAKTPVADTNNLTEDEKAKVKEEVEKSNPGLPTGTTIEVSNGGSVTITYPDGSIDIIPATDAVVPTTPTPQTDAEKNGITNPAKTPVADTNNLTEEEKAKVKEEVEKSNPGLPSGTTIEVSNGGSVTITYPDGSIDIIPATDAVVPTTPTPQTDAEKNGITNPAKTPVADTNNLTEDEKAKVKEEVEKSNPGLPTGTTIVVGNDGSVTITYPDGSVDTISGTDTVTPNTDTTAPEAPIVNTPKAGDKTITGTAEPGSTVTVTFPDGSTVTTTADENGNFTVDVPAGVELKEGDKVTATATDGAGNKSASAIVTVVSKGSSTGTTETGTENGNSANSGTEEVISKSTSETASQGNTVNNVSGAVKEATEDNKQAVLPKTGEESGAMSLIGLVALSGLGLLAFKRRRKEEE